MSQASEQIVLSPGDIVGGHRIEREIGRGAMAVVYLATQLDLDRPVALKILSGALARDEEYVTRFFNEARSAAALSHRHIVQAYSAGTLEQSVYFFAMEYVDGDTLLHRVHEGGALRVTEGLRVASEIAGALEYGWRHQQLTHGDIKPENIMINQMGDSKLADFGLAKISRYDLEESGIMLTPLYAAPELILRKHRKGDCRPDIYSFGATLYHVLAGHPPFPGDDPKDVMQRHVSEALTPVKDINAKVPARVSDFISQLLEKEPDARPRNWTAVTVQLTEIAEGLTAPRKQAAPRKPKPRAVTTPRPRRPKKQPKQRQGFAVTAVFIAALLTMAIIAIAGFLYQRNQPPPKPPTETPPEVGGTTPTPDTSTVPRSPDPETPNGGGGGLDPDQRGQLEEIGTLAEEHGLAPTEDKRLDSLAGHLREVEGGDGQEGVAPIDEEIVPGTGRHPPPVSPATAAKLRTESYLAFVGDVLDFQYRLGMRLGPLVEKGEAWLVRHPDPSPEHDRVTFLVGTVFPALQEFLPKLVLGKARLMGEPVPGRRYAKRTIKDVQMSGFQLATKTAYGETAVMHPWREFNTPPYLMHFGKMAFVRDSLPLMEKRPFLALATMYRATSSIEDALASVPEGSEKMMWRTLGQDMARGATERKAVEFWRSAQEACAKLERVKAYRLIQSLKETESVTAELYAAEIARIEGECVAVLPDARAARLLRDARQQVATDPRQALYLVGAAAARYGNLDFPEKATAVQTRDEALREIASQPPRVIGVALTLRALPGLATDVRLAQLWQVTKSLAENPLVTAEARKRLNDLYAVLLMNTGDWAGAWREIAKESFAENARVPQPVKVVSLRAKIQLADRFEDPDVTPAAAFAELVGLQDAVLLRDIARTQAMANAAEAALKLGSFSRDMAVENWLSVGRQELTQDEGKRLAFATVAWLIEAGREATAKEALAGLLAPGGWEGVVVFAPEEKLSLADITTVLAGGRLLGLDNMAMTGSLRAYYWRMLVSALAARPDACLGNDLPLTPEAVSALLGQGAVSATLWRDFVTLQIARLLVAGNAEAAARFCDSALEVIHPDAADCYPDLCFYRAGCELLQRHHGQAAETLSLVGLSSIASPSERTVAQAWAEDNFKSRALAEALKNSPRARFWHCWLWGVEHLSRDDGSAVPKRAAEMATCCRSLAQRRLADSLAFVAKRTEE